MPDPIVVPLHSRRRRRALALQNAQYLVPTLALLATGVQGLLQRESTLDLALAVVEVITCVALTIALVRSVRRELRGAATKASASVDWITIGAAFVLGAEAYEHWRITQHIPRPVVLLAMVTLLAGLYQPKLMAAGIRRRALRLSDDEVRIGGRFFRRFRAPWSEISAIDITTTEARLTTTAGTVRRIHLADLDNEDEVRAALEQARQRIPPATRATSTVRVPDAPFPPVPDP